MESPNSSVVSSSPDHLSFNWTNEADSRVIFKVSVNNPAIIVKPKSGIVEPKSSIEISITNRDTSIKPKIYFDSFFLENETEISSEKISEFLKNNKNFLKKAEMQKDLIFVAQEKNVGFSSPIFEKMEEKSEKIEKFEKIEKSDQKMKFAIFSAVAVAAGILIFK